VRRIRNDGELVEGPTQTESASREQNIAIASACFILYFSLSKWTLSVLLLNRIRKSSDVLRYQPPLLSSL
jgi:hypothetical protein